ncbi:MAG: translation elongation factor Ts [Dongiaceae bacterium]
MTQITAAMVNKLREMTGAGMMECKAALVEANGDFEAAADILRKKSGAAASKKAGRKTAEGLVAIAIEGNKGAMAQINCETDFVARNEKFQAYAAKVAKMALSDSPEKVKSAAASELEQLIATIGENMSLSRVGGLSVKQGAIVSYVHNAVNSTMGKIGVLVALESTAPAAKLETVGKQLAMHIAAARPDAVNIADADPKKVEKERNFFTDQAKESGKPADIIAKMVEGRIRKYYEEVILMEQLFVVDGESKIAKVVEAAAKDAGAPIKVAGFLRFALGEDNDSSLDAQAA